MKILSLKRIIAFGLFVAVLFGLVCSASAEFVFVANHPDARSLYPDPTLDPNNNDNGRSIKVLKAYSGRIYMGFGQDDGPPLGGYQPLNIRYVNPATDQVSAPQGALSSQEMSIMEVILGKLYIPAEDWEGDDYVVCTSGGCMDGDFSSSAAHVFAATSYNGNLYMAGGHNDGSGKVWRSTNGGASWTEIRKIPKTTWGPCCARTSLLVVYNNKLYVQAYEYDWSEQNQPPCYPTSSKGGSCNWEPIPKIHIYNGSSWTVSTDSIVNSATSRLNSKVFAGKMVFGERQYYLKTYNGSVVNSVNTNVRTFTISGDWLYILKNDGSIYRTKDLSSWRYIDTATTDARSIEVLNDIVYVGTRQGQVYKSLKLTEQICIVPILKLLLLDE